jgi:hypothetical protein
MDIIGNSPEINDHQSQYVSWLATPEESRNQQGQSLRTGQGRQGAVEDRAHRWHCYRPFFLPYSAKCVE